MLHVSSEEAPSKAPTKSVTWDTSQASGWLNCDASEKAWRRLRTLLTFHREIGWLKARAPRKVARKLVTRRVSHASNG